MCALTAGARGAERTEGIVQVIVLVLGQAEPLLLHVVDLLFRLWTERKTKG